jgi:hypothetical protein
MESHVLAHEDFDYRVRQHLHALHGSRGQQGLSDAFEAIKVASTDKTREDIANWPAYLCTLLRVQISEAKQQSKDEKKQPRFRKFKKLAVMGQLWVMLRASFFVALAYGLVHSLLQAAAYLGFGRLESVVVFLGCAYLIEDKLRMMYVQVFGTKLSLFHPRSVESSPG